MALAPEDLDEGEVEVNALHQHPTEHARQAVMKQNRHHLAQPLKERSKQGHVISGINNTCPLPVSVADVNCVYAAYSDGCSLESSEEYTL